MKLGLSVLVLFGLVLPAFGLGGPAMAVSPVTMYDLVVDTIIAEFGFIPATALVNGFEVSSESALALLRANPMLLASADNVYPWDHDVGVGTRTGGNECTLGASITALSVTPFPPQDSLINRETQGVPNPLDAGPTAASTFLCAFGKIPAPPPFAYVVGEVGAEKAANVVTFTGCAFSGAWANSAVPCHTNDFTGGNLVGHVAHVLTNFCFFTICINVGQLVGGIANWAPAPVGAQDAVVIGLHV